MTMIKKMKNRKGFTLVELLVVIAIIGILVAIALPKFSTASDTAKIAKIEADLRTLDSALSLFQAKTGSAATAIGDVNNTTYLAAVVAPPTGTVNGKTIGAAYALTGGRATLAVTEVEKNAGEVRAALQ